MWFSVWTWGSTFNQKKNIEIDSEILNEAFFVHLVFETIPQLILQTTNSRDSGKPFNSAAIASVAASSYTALSGLYTFFVYKVRMFIYLFIYLFINLFIIFL